MSGGDDIAARVRAIHAARAEVDASLGLDSTPTTSGGVVPAAWLADARAARDDAADAYDILVRRVWEAATGDTHEGPASVDVLLEAVAGLRARAEKAEAERDALRAAVRECHALERVAADPPPRQVLAAAIAADEAWERVVALVGEG